MDIESFFFFVYCVAEIFLLTFVLEDNIVIIIISIIVSVFIIIIK